MRNILLTLSYDGTDFCGWQRQDRAQDGKPMRTVQAEIESALEKIHKEKTNLYGSGRTDSGVHAYGQAANFYSPVDSIPAQNYIRALNAFLPEDIRILKAEEKPEEFNSRFSATSRSYRYFINFQGVLSASQTRYVWDVKNYRPDLDRLNALSSCLRGELDCASFAASGDQSVSTCRYIDNAHFFIQKDIFGKELLVFEIEANAFLWKMVRTLTGTIINLDKNKAECNALKNILDGKDRTKAGVTAPPTGLFLWEVKFDGIRRHV